MLLYEYSLTGPLARVWLGGVNHDGLPTSLASLGQFERWRRSPTHDLFSILCTQTKFSEASYTCADQWDQEARTMFDHEEEVNCHGTTIV